MRSGVSETRLLIHLLCRFKMWLLLSRSGYFRRIFKEIWGAQVAEDVKALFWKYCFTSGMLVWELNLWLYKKNTKKCDSKIHECQCTYSCYGHVSYSMFCTFFMIFVPETIELKSKYVGLFYLIGNSLEVSSIFTWF